MFFSVTKTSTSDLKEGHVLNGQLVAEHKGIVKRCEIYLGDKAYDNTKLIVKLWSKYQIKPVIEIQNQWRDGEKTRVLAGKEDIVYDYSGKLLLSPDEQTP